MCTCRRIVIACTLFLFGLSASADKPIAGSQHERLLALRAAYLDGLFQAKPHLATFMGDHRFDGKLPDLSAPAVEKRLAELARQRAELAKLDLTDLPLDDRIDAAIMGDGIALEELYLREIREWTWSPRIYDSFPFYDPRDILGNRISDIIHGTFAPAAERLRSVTAQLEALPRFIDEQMKAIAQPSAVHLQQATKENRGRIEFFANEVKEFTKGDAAAEKARLAALESLRRYQAFLESDALKQRATHDWKLGAALYRKKFPLALQTDLSPEKVLPLARLEFERARKALYLLAAQMHRRFWPAEPTPPANADAKTQAQIINRVKAEISKDHPRPAELVAAHAANLDRLRAFIVEHNLVELPPPETLTVEPMPLFKRGATAAEYLAPGMLDKSSTWKATYFVDPVDPTWPHDKVESYLRASNNYDVEMTACHEAYPGHHTQTYQSRKDLNPLRATLWNGPMVEGWAVYGEKLMTELGYGGKHNDRYRFIDLSGQMVVAANAILDIELQSGRMTDEEALHFMIVEGFQERARAERKLWRAKLDSTQLVQYFLGFTEIEDLEREVRAQVGRAFSQRKFNDGLVGHGSIPVKYLRQYLLVR